MVSGRRPRVLGVDMQLSHPVPRVFVLPVHPRFRADGLSFRDVALDGVGAVR